MDDMVLWSQDKQQLKHWAKAIECYLNETLKQELKPIQLNHVKNGLPFLGFLIKPYHVKLLQKSKRRYLRKLKINYQEFLNGTITDYKFQQKCNALSGFIGHAAVKGFLYKTNHSFPLNRYVEKADYLWSGANEF